MCPSLNTDSVVLNNRANLARVVRTVALVAAIQSSDPALQARALIALSSV